MRKLDKDSMTDLRNIVEAHLGEPLAASVQASLWRCPVCAPDMYSLLMVSADEIRCVGRSVCDAGVSQWIQCMADKLEEQVLPEMGL